MLIQKLWDVSWIMWDHHNNVLHKDKQLAVLGTKKLKSVGGGRILDDIHPSERYIYRSGYSQ